VSATTAADLLRANWVGDLGYTRPTADGLYPHQWNWDSAFAALGWATLDPARGYAELGRLVAAQHADGLITHIAFSPRRENYFPAVDWWPPRLGRDGRRVSSLSQPPVAATCLRLLFARAPDEDAARRLLAPLDRWHAWWLGARDPHATGEHVVIHPWESGRDNAPDWDAALAVVPSLDVSGLREDTRWVGLDERPSHADYGRYAWLVRRMRTGDVAEQRALAASGDFRVLDPGVSSALAAACADLARLAEQLGEHALADRSAARADAVEAALSARAGDRGVAEAVDLRTGDAVPTPGAGWALNLLRDRLPDRALEKLERACCDDADALASPYGVRSWARADARFEADRYWRGPVWANVTWLCALGLERHARAHAAALLRARLGEASRGAGFREYVDGDTGEGRGARGFTWTAALAAWTSAGGGHP
jgi:Glycosyl hydrolase family 63 C-terminal domain